MRWVRQHNGYGWHISGRVGILVSPVHVCVCDCVCVGVCVSVRMHIHPPATGHEYLNFLQWWPGWVARFLQWAMWVDKVALLHCNVITRTPMHDGQTHYTKWHITQGHYSLPTIIVGGGEGMDVSVKIGNWGSCYKWGWGGKPKKNGRNWDNFLNPRSQTCQWLKARYPVKTKRGLCLVFRFLFRLTPQLLYSRSQDPKIAKISHDDITNPSYKVNDG